MARGREGYLGEGEKWSVYQRRGAPLGKVDVPQRKEVSQRGGVPQRSGGPSGKWGVPGEGGSPLREAGVPSDKRVRAPKAVPSEKRKPQRSPGHRKPGTRHRRRRPLTHRSCSAPLRVAAGPRVASGGGVRSDQLGSRGGGSLRWRPRRQRRQDDGRPTDRLRGWRGARSGGGGARARAGALTPGGRSRLATLGAAARSRRSFSH